MFHTTNAIVLSKLKYRDNDLIVGCYTQEFGVLSFLLRGVLKSKKGHTKVAYFQLLSQIQIVIDYKPNKSLHTIKDVKINTLYTTLHTQVVKSTIVMFLADVLSMVLKEEEANLQLFKYIETSLNWLDANNEVSNFHLLFLLQLTKYLGCYPDVSDIAFPYFNLSSGRFENKSISAYTVSDDNLKFLKTFLGIIFDDLATTKMSAQQRQNFLEMMLLYYDLHMGHFKKPKSLTIFSQVFS